MRGSRCGRARPSRSTRTQPALDLTVLFNGFKPLFAALSPQDVNQLSGEIIQVLQGEGGTINSLLAHTASLTSTARRPRRRDRPDHHQPQRRARHGRRRATTSSTSCSVQLQRFVSGLSADRVAIGSSLANINELAADTAGLLSQARPPLKADIADLGELVGHAEQAGEHEGLRALHGAPAGQGQHR